MLLGLKSMGHRTSDPTAWRNRTMRHLDLGRLRTAHVVSSPFEHVIVQGFLSRETIDRINETFPLIPSSGSYSIDNLTSDMVIKAVIEELDSRECEEIIEHKFNVNLL